MDAPLNLTPARGPSVWDKPRQSTDPWQVAAVATGVLLVTAGWPFRSRASQLAASAGLVGLALGLRGDRLPAALASLRHWFVVGKDADEQLDQTLEASFPASDPPSR